MPSYEGHSLAFSDLSCEIDLTVKGVTSWTVLKTWPSLSISDSIGVGGGEMIRCAASLVFLISMIGGSG